MRAGPRPVRMVATWPSGTCCTPSGPGTVSGSVARSEVRVRASGANRTVTSRVSPAGSTQSPTSMPANAGRSACATCPAVTPIDPASARSSSTSSSGFCPCVDRSTSTAPGTFRTSASAWSATFCSSRESRPMTWIRICFWSPKPLVVIDAVAPASLANSARSPAATSFWLRSRSCFGFSRT